jgi:hypothetical protein
MSRLFNKYCSITIGDSPGRKFEYPPFDIEFEQKSAPGAPTTTTAKLYNPNDDTIAIGTPKLSGKAWTFPQIIIDAGFDEEHGTCIVGSIFAAETKRQRADRIFEMKISDATNKWRNAIINYTYKTATATIIINDMLSRVGMYSDKIQLGEEKTYKTFTASYLSSAIETICRDTKSEIYFKNGMILIQPKASPRTRNIILLNENTGLLNRPEKTSTGIKFQTLFLYNLNIGDFAKIESKNINGVYSIFNGVKKFSTFQSSECEFEARPE